MNGRNCDTFPSQRQKTSIPSNGGSSNYRHGNMDRRFLVSQPLYVPQPCYSNRQYVPLSYYCPPIYAGYDRHGDFPPLATTGTTTVTNARQNQPIWNPTNPPTSPLKRSSSKGTSILSTRAKNSQSTKNVSNPLTSPLKPSSAKDTSNSVAQSKTSNNTKNLFESSPSHAKVSPGTPPEDYVDPEIIDAAKNLKLPLDGHKYSVANWKDAMILCYRWKTNTNEDERQFYRMSKTTTSLSSSNLKSVKRFCDNVLKRKSKRRQFAIHWKDSGLKKIVDQASSSQDILFEHGDPALEKILDDYFSGRTRSTEYNQVKEKVLEDRQKEIFALWDALQSDHILSTATSHQKLYLVQLAIERPYSKKAEIKTKDEVIAHDVTIEGFGGKSYWDQSNSVAKNNGKLDAIFNASPNALNGVLPLNKSMTDRFWKCVEAVAGPVRQGKRRRSPDPFESSCDNRDAVKKNAVERLSKHTSYLMSEKKSNKAQNSNSEVDKENEMSAVVPV
ncbi:unnamed protein product [Pseudo-nitzschia multistriata]|uniref:Uncharacterized protein n=1 Tax=Pseudo-nitzschia multistriata TaxID=183589 RepID=A0A448YWB2_9STRA|nr:unnamed protein product [Pseudo-nitzschia multistriata]